MVLSTAISEARLQVSKMDKQITYHIQETENGLALKVVLSKSLHLSRREISRLKFTNGLLCNGEQVRITQQVQTGDEIQIIFSEKDQAHATRMLGKPEILYEDEDLVIVNKPSGMPCHPSHEHLDDDMGTLLQNYYKSQFTIRAVGRLDKDVSGVMVYAKNQPSAARLSAQRKEDALRKEYVAIVHGHFEQKKGTLTYRLEKVHGHKERLVTEQGKLCITEYEVLQEGNDMSLVSVHIVTGRTHQIRAGMAYAGHPIVGDRLYGGDTSLLNKAALHCARVTLQQPFQKNEIAVEAPMRLEMQNVWKKASR